MNEAMRKLLQQSACAILLASVPLASHAEGFDEWLAQFRDDAGRAGIHASTLDAALNGIGEDETVVKLDRKQPEGQITLEEYLANTVTKRRVRLGRELMEEHRPLLAKISHRYGVQAQYIVALWGIETDYGNYTGNFSVVQSLATLAYEGRRAEFFRGELLNALRIIDRGEVGADEMTGSWAGAMGNCQFMPSTYLKFAVDYDHDGKRDIWNNMGDTFASIANYLHELGWNPKVAAMHHGVPTENYAALLQWNKSRYFATAVSTLAAEIKEKE